VPGLQVNDLATVDSVDGTAARTVDPAARCKHHAAQLAAELAKLHQEKKKVSTTPLISEKCILYNRSTMTHCRTTRAAFFSNSCVQMSSWFSIEREKERAIKSGKKAIKSLRAVTRISQKICLYFFFFFLLLFTSPLLLQRAQISLKSAHSRHPREKET
jgi:hypothetical protein